MAIELITGPMFSGKTETLIRRLRAAQASGRIVSAFKHAIDYRCSPDHIVSHSGLRIPAESVTSAQQILDLLPRRPQTADLHRLPSTLDCRRGTTSAGQPPASSIRHPARRNPQLVVGIDEAQFFASDLALAAQQLAARGMRVIVAGLDLDYLAQPFAAITELLSIADRISRKRAVCSACGSSADFTQRLVASEKRVLVGGTGIYEPRCATCFVPGFLTNRMIRVHPCSFVVTGRPPGRR